MKKAFLVGINTYPTSPLRGCVNDVNLMVDYLKVQNFDSIVTLLDNNATYTNIIKGLRALVSGVKAGDTIMFHYSGHGSQVPDRNRDEADGLDECICPVDIDFYRGIYITDDELNSIFSQVSNIANVEVILDCCHSGTGLRSLTPNFSSRHLPSPNDLTKDQVATSRELVVTGSEIKANYVLWAACRSTETAADARIGRTFNGAFTYSIINTLKNGVANRLTLEKGVSAMMRSKGWSQHAQLECSAQQQKQGFLSLPIMVTRDYPVKSKPSLFQKIKALFRG